MSLKPENPKISLIIPVYNVELYLRKSLDSAINQTFKDVEIIAVNDGSTDSSYEILKEYKSKYNNIKVISIKNSGLSNARNVGIRESKGEYLAFLDSDDYIHPKFLETLYNLIIKNDADISCCNLNLYFPKSGLQIYVPTILWDRTYKKDKALRKLIYDWTIHHFAWNKLCKKSIFTDNNIEFRNMYFEDVVASPQLFYNAKKIAITNKALYNYTQRRGSILKTMNAQKINDYTISMAMIREYLENKQDYDNYKFAYRLYARRTKLVNYHSIFMMHLRCKNFSGIVNNIRANNKSIEYFKGNKYKAGTGNVQMPYIINAPDNKSQKQHANN